MSSLITALVRYLRSICPFYAHKPATQPPMLISRFMINLRTVNSEVPDCSMHSTERQQGQSTLQFRRSANRLGNIGERCRMAGTTTNYGMKRAAPKKWTRRDTVRPARKHEPTLRSILCTKRIVTIISYASGKIKAYDIEQSRRSCVSSSFSGDPSLHQSQPYC